jgi:hypothetical protein
MAKPPTRKNGAPSAASDRAPRPSPGPTPNHSDIARRAYDLYLARGGAHGNDVTDWLQAEGELRQAALRRPRV